MSSKVFNVVTFTGNGGTQSITGVGFQPDFVWIKARSYPRHHWLFDSIRGVSRFLQPSKSSGTTSETYISGKGITSFDSDGFTWVNETNNGFNTNGETYVAWCWKANGTGVSNTNGSITSTVSANVDAGFSIVSYTGTGSAGTIGHGLSKQPELMIVKNRDKSWAWRVFVKDITTADGQVLTLNLTNAKETLGGGSTAWDVSEMSSSVIGIGSYGDTNNSGDDFICYAFHSVDGYSKVGSYTGNGSSDGTFVYTGFRPAFILVKRSSAAGKWLINDSARDPDNQVDLELYPDDSIAEYSGVHSGVDFLSNGFKWRTTNGDKNGSGSTIIYIAFAENPFKHTNAR